MSASEIDPITVVDELRAVADKAADLIERLAGDNDRMRGAAAGILPDGTPVEDMLDELKERRVENARFHRVLREIRLAVNARQSSKATVDEIKEIFTRMEEKL